MAAIQRQSISIAQVESTLSNPTTHETMYIICIRHSLIPHHSSTAHSLRHLHHQGLNHIDIGDFAIIKIIFNFLQIFFGQTFI